MFQLRNKTRHELQDGQNNSSLRSSLVCGFGTRSWPENPADVTGLCFGSDCAAIWGICGRCQRNFHILKG